VYKRRFDTTEQSIADLTARGFDIYVADLAPTAHSPATLPVDRPLAVVFGSEVQGVSEAARRAAKGVVRVPMVGLTESLNVSVSAAIVLHHLCERRRALVGADLSAEERARFVQSWLAAEEKAVRGLKARTGERMPRPGS
jgi:tRNA (guanosine-2'-O-)-methyltransferase